VRRSIRLSSEGWADDLPDGGRITVLHVLGCPQGSGRGPDRLVGQREDVKEVAIEGDEVLVAQRIAGHAVVRDREAS
jgi:hypothetical protein